MIYWLLAVTLLVELIAYTCLTLSFMSKQGLRRFIFGGLGFSLLTLAAYALMSDWQVWLLPAFIIPYQLINLARAAAYRLPPKRLRSASLHTFFWLVALQVTLFGVGTGMRYYDEYTVITLVSLQAIVAVILFGSTARTWQRIKPHIQRTPMTDSELPSLSVLIPARNETSDLRECLESFIASDYPKLEIIALDDCSTDKRTPEIIRSFAADGVRFIAGREPDAQRWFAKNSAYNDLRAQASGEILLFCGVDVRVEKETLRHLVEIMYARKRDMISLLPLRPHDEKRRLSFIQAMRYWWELGFPRRYFNRPPVLSTLWLIRATALDKAGGFAAAARKAVPEAYFAKELVKSDRYIFLRSTPALPVFSTKSLDEQYETAVRIRYPQIHHRVSFVVIIALYELIFLIGPFISLPFYLITNQLWVVWLLSFITIGLLSYSYYLIAIRTHLNNVYLGLLTAPVAFLLDIVLLHTSMYKYEFSEVIWHERNVSGSILQVIPSLPRIEELPSTSNPLD